MYGLTKRMLEELHWSKVKINEVEDLYDALDDIIMDRVEDKEHEIEMLLCNTCNLSWAKVTQTAIILHMWEESELDIDLGVIKYLLYVDDIDGFIEFTYGKTLKGFFRGYLENGFI